MHRMIATPTSIREYRSLHGLTLQAFGERFDVNKTTAMRWELGRIPAERVPEISRATGIARECLRPDLFDIDRTPSDASADPAKAPAASLASVSQSDAEPQACLTETRSRPTENRTRAIA